MWLVDNTQEKVVQHGCEIFTAVFNPYLGLVDHAKDDIVKLVSHSLFHRIFREIVHN